MHLVSVLISYRVIWDVRLGGLAVHARCLLSSRSQSWGFFWYGRTEGEAWLRRGEYVRRGEGPDVPVCTLYCTATSSGFLLYFPVNGERWMGILLVDTEYALLCCWGYY